MRLLLIIILWCILLVLCWPLALLVAVAFPLIWLVALPFRLAGVAVEGVFSLIRALFLLPARVLSRLFERKAVPQ